MHSVASKAPFCDSGETQRGKKAGLLLPPAMALNRDERHRPSRSKVRLGRRRGSREHTARSRRIFYFMFGVLSIVVVLAWYGWLPGSRSLSPQAAAPRDTRARPQHDAASPWPAAAETQEQRLRREISVLEDSLLRKKALLGIASDVPLDSSLDVEGSPHGDLRGVAGGPYLYDSSGATAAAAGAGDVHFLEGDRSSPYEDPSSPRAGPGPVASPGSGLGAGAEGGAGAGVLAGGGGGSGGGVVSSAYPNGVAGEAMFGANPVRASLESKGGLIREPVPLIVGGTDGSGTRGVVALLQRLKVPMVVEDTGTMDIHASPYMVKGGWPEVVRPVMEWAHGAGYDTQAAPLGLRKTTIAAMGKLRAQMDKVSAFHETAATGWQ